MKGCVIISHGLQSSPDASKATALAHVGKALGWRVEVPDYRDIDALSQLGDVPARIERLRAIACKAPTPRVLAGSSMGAFISGHVSCEVPVLGLFLMAPPIRLEVAPFDLNAAKVPTMVVHGWDDELIPATGVIDWAAARRDELRLVPDRHRLERHIDYCAQAFDGFLRGLVP